MPRTRHSIGRKPRGAIVWWSIQHRFRAEIKAKNLRKTIPLQADQRQFLWGLYQRWQGNQEVIDTNVLSVQRLKANGLTIKGLFIGNIVHTVAI